MPRRPALLTVLLALLGLALAPVGAGAAPVFGLGDQKPDMFGDARFAQLGIVHARRVVPWDALYIGWQRDELDTWMNAARAAHVEPLIAFTRSRRVAHKRTLPTVKRLQRSFRRFRYRYPWVREFIPWNEANHRSQPTWRSPHRAAGYYKMMRRECRTCTVVAADVLDIENMVPWLRKFRRHVPHEPLLWGLHNYIDANRFRTTGTRRLLRAVSGTVWFTEVGGIVQRKALVQRGVRAPDSIAHAATVMRWLFQLAAISSRVERVYVYHWNAGRGRREKWDSGLVGADGSPRPALSVLRSELRRLGLGVALRAASPRGTPAL